MSDCRSLFSRHACAVEGKESDRWGIIILNFNNDENYVHIYNLVNAYVIYDKVPGSRYAACFSSRYRASRFRFRFPFFRLLIAPARSPPLPEVHLKKGKTIRKQFK